MDWRKYEKLITDRFQKLYPSCLIEHNVKLHGILSNTDRQIDILISTIVAGYDIKIVIDCKYYSSNIDAKDVESFIGMLQDLKINKGVLITNEGFSKAAYFRAKNNNTPDIQIDIVNIFEVNGFPGFGALIYRGPYGILLSTPPGWIVDGTQNNRNHLAYLSKIGKTDNELMYVNIEPKNNPSGKLYKKDLLKYFINLHENDTRKIYPESSIEYKNHDLPNDSVQCLIRIITRNTNNQNLKENIEYTAFIEYETFIVCVVYNTIVGNSINPLEYIIQTIDPLTIEMM